MKQFISWSVIIISLLLSVTLMRSVYDLFNRESVITDARERLSKAQEENEQLKKEAEYVQSPAYIEKQARDKLNLARPDETVLIVPKATPPPETSDETEETVVWKMWLEVFRISL